MISTLVNVDINPKHRSGNTTRIVNNAIQLLFNGDSILVLDHYNTVSSNQRLLKLIQKRLYDEHHITSEDLDINSIDKGSKTVLKLRKK